MSSLEFGEIGCKDDNQYKGVRRGLGMTKYDSLWERFGGEFQEALKRTKKLEPKFLERGLCSAASLVNGYLFWWPRRIRSYS